MAPRLLVSLLALAGPHLKTRSAEDDVIATVYHAAISVTIR